MGDLSGVFLGEFWDNFGGDFLGDFLGRFLSLIPVGGKSVSVLRRFILLYQRSSGGLDCPCDQTAKPILC